VREAEDQFAKGKTRGTKRSEDRGGGKKLPQREKRFVLAEF